MMPKFSTILKDTNTLNTKVVRWWLVNTSIGSIKGQDIIKAVDDNINVDMNNRTEDVENAVESDKVKETLEDVVL